MGDKTFYIKMWEKFTSAVNTYKTPYGLTLGNHDIEG